MPLSKRENILITVWGILFTIGATFFAFKAYTLNIEIKAEEQSAIRIEEKKMETLENLHLYQMDAYSDLVPKNKKGPKNVVLLTIDDGPTKRTKGMMDTLDKHNAKAIFFINGTHIINVPAGTLKEGVERGFTIGNHTWSHPNLKKISPASAQIEIDRNSEIIKKETGISPKFFRPPYGVSTKEVRDYVRSNGMIYMNWTGSALDWEPASKDKKVFISNVIRDLHPGEIILLHEHPITAEYLDDLLTAIEEKDYTFLDPKNITN
jgi:peptidoglycan/xylan/chitin deacetylase (PgdA/CDA1 family)